MDHCKIVLGGLLFFNISVQHVHVISKLSNIVVIQVTGWGCLYQNSLKTENTDMGQDDVTISDFKGHSTWFEFKQKLLLNISLIKSVTGFSQVHN